MLSGFAEILSATFSPDGNLILTGSWDSTARVWNAENGMLLRSLIGHTGFVQNVAFSPNGKTVLTGSWDNTARLWNSDYHDFIAEACTLLDHDFYDVNNERLQFDIHDAEPTCPQFAPADQPLKTPMPPTTSPIPNLTIPVWTPVSSPTASPTFVSVPLDLNAPTATPTYPGILLTFTPTPIASNTPTIPANPGLTP